MSRTDITRPEDLKGKRIGFSGVGALSHLVLMLWAREMGWDPVHDISLLANGMGGELIWSGRIDAFAADEIAVGEAIRQGYRDLVDTAVYKFPMPGSGVNALEDWLPKNREAAARFIKSTVDALALIKNDKAAAFAAMAKWYGITDPHAQEHVYAQATQLPSKPYPSVEGIKAMMSVYSYREMQIRRRRIFTTQALWPISTRAATSIRCTNRLRNDSRHRVGSASVLRGRGAAAPANELL